MNDRMEPDAAARLAADGLRRATRTDNHEIAEEFSAWALDVLHSRRELMPRMSAMQPARARRSRCTERAPPRRTRDGCDRLSSAVHAGGGLEIARLACDPRTVLRGEEWVRGLRGLVAAYREENPDLPTDDLVGSVRAWVRCSAASIYPV